VGPDSIVVEKAGQRYPGDIQRPRRDVAEKPMFRSAFEHRRCLIPASGYYEWQDTSGGKQPYFFTLCDNRPITIAGLCDVWKDIETGESVKSCTMIITEANGFVSAIHDRMPVILEDQSFDAWLTGEAGSELLRPTANEVLQKWPVSKRVNNSRTSDEDPTLIDPIELAPAD
jgi:putative SOS response-associated peptidase YedK